MNIVESAARCLSDESIPEISAILVAFSGGPDSTAMLHVLAVALGRAVAIAYYNHGLRDAQAIHHEVESARRWGRVLRCAVHVGGPDTEEMNRLSDVLGVEAAARICRYRYLDRIAEETGYRFIAAAHTRDDEAETMVLGFFRGAGLDGLTGIPLRKGRIIRPLIRVTAAEVAEYLERNDLPCLTDETNLDTRFMRNAIRRDLIPVLGRIFPGYPVSLQRLSEKMKMTAEYVRKKTAERLPVYRFDDGHGVYLGLESFRHAEPIERLTALYEAYDRLFSPEEMNERRGLPYRHLRSLVFRTEFPEIGLLLTGAGVRIRARSPKIEVTRDVVSAYEKGYLIAVRDAEPAVYENRDAGFTAYVAPEARGDGGACEIGIGSAFFPLLIRSKYPGDVVQTGRGCKSIKKLLQQWNVTESDRIRLPVVQDRQRILAVLGSYAGYNDWIADEHGPVPAAVTNSPAIHGSTGSGPVLRVECIEETGLQR